MGINIDDIQNRLITRHMYRKEDVEKIIPKLNEINRIKEEKGAIIMAHYYQIPPIQLIADNVGDSLNLALAARDTAGSSGIIISSTVYFMAEMIKILSPKKRVMIPDKTASCSIAEGMNAHTVKRIREEYPDAAIVAYINTTAEVKSEVDAVCTSANAKSLIQKIENDTVIMVPDYLFAKNIINSIADKSQKRYLAYKQIRDGKIIVEEPLTGKESSFDSGAKPPILDDGTCIVHNKFTPYDIYEYKRKGTIDAVLAHPEVRPSVAKLADAVGGTGRMIEYLKSKPDAKRILFLTECDMAAPLRERFPEREFITTCRLCEYMKKNNLDNLLESMEKEVYEVKVEENIAKGARRSLERMFELTSSA